MYGYGYEPTVEISPEHLLQKVTQEAIFEFALKQNFQWGIRYKSPFREHSKGLGTCRFEKREDGTILFVDFGDLEGKTHRNCFRMVMDCERKEGRRCDLQKALKLICEHFQLPLTKEHYAEVLPQHYVYNEEEKPHNSVKIKYEPKPFTKFDLREWGQYLIKPEHLEEDNIHAVARYRINSPSKGIRLFTPYKYCYAIDLITRVKIYQPYQTDYKFITNFTEDTIGNIDNLPPTGYELIIAKAYKDHRVIRNLIEGSNVVYTHNEGCIPNLEILTMLTQRFKLITIFYDNDPTGIVAAIKLMEVFNAIRPLCCRMVYLPEGSPKDPSDFVKKEGRADTMQVFRSIKLIN